MTSYQKIRAHFILALLVFAAAAGATAAPAPGEVAPDLVGKTLDGELVNVSKYSGKVVVVSFWATWCPYCLKELPILEGIQKIGGSEQVQVIAVNTESRDVFRRVARELKTMKMKLVYDPDKKGADAYGVKGIPHLVIIGRDGRVMNVFRGYGESSLDGIVTSINQALATPAPELPEPQPQPET
jgi:thiol-disulfide isomerase/thioredoxin